MNWLEETRPWIGSFRGKGPREGSRRPERQAEVRRGPGKWKPSSRRETARPASESEALQHAVQPGGEAHVRSGQPRERLVENAARTVLLATDEAPDLEQDHDTPPTKRKIVQSVLTGVVHLVQEPPQSVPTSPPAAPSPRCRRCRIRRFHPDAHVVDPVAGRYEQSAGRQRRAPLLHDE